MARGKALVGKSDHHRAYADSNHLMQTGCAQSQKMEQRILVSIGRSFIEFKQCP